MSILFNTVHHTLHVRIFQLGVEMTQFRQHHNNHVYIDPNSQLSGKWNCWNHDRFAAGPPSLSTIPWTHVISWPAKLRSSSISIGLPSVASLFSTFEIALIDVWALRAAHAASTRLFTRRFPVLLLSCSASTAAPPPPQLARFRLFPCFSPSALAQFQRSVQKSSKPHHQGHIPLAHGSMYRQRPTYKHGKEPTQLTRQTPSRPWSLKPIWKSNSKNTYQWPEHSQSPRNPIHRGGLLAIASRPSTSLIIHWNLIQLQLPAQLQQIDLLPTSHLRKTPTFTNKTSHDVHRSPTSLSCSGCLARIDCTVISSALNKPWAHIRAYRRRCRARDNHGIAITLDSSSAPLPFSRLAQGIRCYAVGHVRQR